jgi:hypothetical protein
VYKPQVLESEAVSHRSRFEITIISKQGSIKRP